MWRQGEEGGLGGQRLPPLHGHAVEAAGKPHGAHGGLEQDVHDPATEAQPSDPGPAGDAAPLPAPHQGLRRSRETCRHCHWNIRGGKGKRLCFPPCDCVREQQNVCLVHSLKKTEAASATSQGQQNGRSEAHRTELETQTRRAICQHSKDISFQ